MIASKHNGAVPELQLKLGRLVLDDDEMFVDSLDVNHLNYGDEIVMLLEIISLQTSEYFYFWRCGQNYHSKLY